MGENVMTLKLVPLFMFLIFICGCIGKIGIGKPVVEGISNELGEVSREDTEVITKIRVYNPNPFPLPLKDVLTEIHVNGRKIGEGSALKSEIKPSSESLVVSTKINNRKIPEWWIEHIKNGEKSRVEFRGHLVFDLKITEFRFPIERSGEIKTDVLKVLRTKGKTGPVRVKPTKPSWGEVNSNYSEILIETVVENENKYSIKITRFYSLVEMNGIRLSDEWQDVEYFLEPKSKKKFDFKIRLNNSRIVDWWVSHVKNGGKTN
ncbi:MAG TPA: hypothetical protein ENG16_03020, partial [Archaeoglobus sp.]|nr:hypothetical protein [Archaeoglobus sp.]